MTNAWHRAFKDMSRADAAIDRANVLIVKSPDEAVKYLHLPEVYDSIVGYYGRRAWETLLETAKAAKEKAVN